MALTLSLFDSPSGEEKPVELIEPEIVEQPKKSRRKKPPLKEQFKDIPTRQVLVDTLSAEDKICPLCGSEMLAIGTEVIRSEIVYTQPKLERIEYIATTYACPECKDTEEPQFIKDHGKPALIPGSYASESLLAYILYRKYGLYIPLYRQEQDFLQMSAPIGRTSMAHWIITASQEYMQPIYDYFHRELLKRRFLMMDETPIQVLKEEGRRAQGTVKILLLAGPYRRRWFKSHHSLQLHFHSGRRKCETVPEWNRTRFLSDG